LLPQAVFALAGFHGSAAVFGWEPVSPLASHSSARVADSRAPAVESDSAEVLFCLAVLQLYEPEVAFPAPVVDLALRRVDFPVLQVRSREPEADSRAPLARSYERMVLRD
jgi:hypothetical protein